MNEQDFNELKEIAQQLNDIRQRNNLDTLELSAKDISSETQKSKVVLVITTKHNYKMAVMRWNKDNFQDMDYNSYINHNK